MSSSGMYKYKFASDPPEALKCVLCSDVAEEPWQHSKCGKVLCKTCLDDYDWRKPCPHCKMVNPQYFEDSRGKAEIYLLAVKCDYMEWGCRWNGAVGTLANHLKRCEFIPVMCPRNCENERGEMNFLTKSDLDGHLADDCPKREFECEYCGKRGTYIFVTQVHDKKCLKKIVPCPNANCQEVMQREQVSEHVKLECEHTVIACKCKMIGCETELERKDMAVHERDDTHHLRMAMERVVTLTELQGSLEKKCGGLQDQCDALKDQCRMLNHKLNNNAITFRVTGYRSKKDNNTIFNSQTFYTGQTGYHMSIKVYPNGNGDAEGTHLSIFAYVIEGKHDAKLKWPLTGQAIITLLNQEKDSDHLTETLRIERSYNIRTRTTTDNLGFAHFISHTALARKPYLKNDSLYFRVTVKAADSKPWLDCTPRI